MTLPSWTVKLAAAAVIPLIVGVGVAISAPSQPLPQAIDTLAGAPLPDADLGVDLAAVTGSTVSEVAARGCDDPSWPIVPFACREAAESKATRN